MAALGMGRPRQAPRPTSPVARRRVELSPAPETIYAVGDVHGCLDKLLRLESLIAEDARERPGAKLIVMLGDNVDRGPDSAGVIEHLAGDPPEGMARLCLAGNHEALLLGFLEEPATFDFWIDFGAAATLLSYGLDINHLRAAMRFGPARIAEELRRAIPEPHIAFLQELPASLSTPDFFFAHAGARPGVALAEQSERDLLWIRDAFLNHESAPFGKRIVHGHTPAPEPVVTPARIGVDTAAYMGGRLTAARISGGEVTFLAAE
jgi:serine/threonine protein phosphatase 1